VSRIADFCLIALTGVLLLTPSGRAQSSPKLNSLIVYGDGFALGVKEPDGWHGDTDAIANKYHVNVVFSPVGGSGDKDVNVRVRVNKKVDENTVEDLNYDMEGYKKDFPNVQFQDISVAHAEYKTFTKLVFIPNQFYEYVAYLNPGPGRPFVVSVAMSTHKTPATDEELKAYESVLKSLVWLSGPKFKVKSDPQ
jgi:hypothetical protein